MRPLNPHIQGWKPAALTVMGLFNPRALRWKIATLTAVACCTVAAAIGILVHNATSQRALNEGIGSAEVSLELAEAEYTRTGKLSDGSVLFAPSDLPGPLAEALNRQAPGHYASWYDTLARNGPWMWSAVRLGSQTLTVRIHMGSEQLSLAALDRAMAKAALTALAVIIPLAAIATQPINRRLRHGARTAHLIASGNLSARIGTAGRARDEITHMSAAVDRMADTLQHRLESEQRFTADVAHELRTPLMGLTTAASLLPHASEAAALVQDRAAALTTLVEDLLEISRLTTSTEPPAHDLVPLGDLVTDLIQRTQPTARLALNNPHTIHSDSRRLERILTNLITNAYRHGKPPVHVIVDQNRITIRDHGPGFPAQLLTHGPQRFYTNAEGGHSRGHGLGLTIAQAHTQTLNARLTLTNTSQGATATLDLSPHAR